MGIEVKVVSYDKLGLERAALEFAEERMETLRKFFTKLEYSTNTPTHDKLRQKMMRQQIRACRSQLAALDALLRLNIEGMEE